MPCEEPGIACHDFTDGKREEKRGEAPSRFAMSMTSNNTVTIMRFRDNAIPADLYNTLRDVT